MLLPYRCEPISQRLWQAPKLPYRMVLSFTLISPCSLRGGGGGGWVGRILTYSIHNSEEVEQTIRKSRDISLNFVYVWLTFSREPLFIFSIFVVFSSFLSCFNFSQLFVFVYEF